MNPLRIDHDWSLGSVEPNTGWFLFKGPFAMRMLDTNVATFGQCDTTETYNWYNYIHVLLYVWSFCVFVWISFRFKRSCCEKFPTNHKLRLVPHWPRCHSPFLITSWRALRSTMLRLGAANGWFHHAYPWITWNYSKLHGIFVGVSTKWLSWLISNTVNI